jgi:hypothetical protein
MRSIQQHRTSPRAEAAQVGTYALNPIGPSSMRFPQELRTDKGGGLR